MSQRVSENGENRKMLLHDRNWRYCREHSQKLHTNEKLHARERLWSESHFRLVIMYVYLESGMRVLRLEEFANVKIVSAILSCILQLFYCEVVYKVREGIDEMYRLQ